MRSLVILLAACGSTSSANPDHVSTDSSAPSPTARAERPAPKIPPKPVRFGDVAAKGKIVAAKVVASVDGGPATERPVYARAGQKVTLHAVLVVEDGGTKKRYSDAAKLADGPVLPLAQAPLVELRWNRIEPAQATMSNGAEPKDFHFETIDYRATELAAGVASLPADVRPTLTPDHGHGVGTMRYQLVALQGDRVIASPGPEARRGSGSGGLTDAVMRVSIRRDDTYLGYLTELYGQPYIWASAGTTDATHQSERLEGSDCADFVVYGMRRLGKRLAYTWTGGLPEVSKLLAAGTRGDDGIYRDKKGQPLPFTQVGDLVLFPRHVGVLTVDRGTIGVLDDQDIIMHSLVDTPKEVPLADSQYADQPLELRRFR